MMFNNTRTMSLGLERCYAMSSGTQPITHVLLDQHYPLNRGETKRFIDNFAKAKGALVLDPGKNLGLHRGWNWACEQLELHHGLKDDDILLGVDPDSWPLTRGWEAAMVKALENWQQTKVPWVGVASEVLHHLPGATWRDWELNGLKVRTPDQNCWFQSLCAFVWGPLKEIGNFWEPNDWYGDLEKNLHPRYRAKGWEFAWLMDYWDEPRKLDSLEDPEYAEWKEALAHRGDTNLDFKDYCKMRGWRTE